MKYIIGIDLGTSGTKTVIFDENGNRVAQSTAEYPLIQPKNGWAEQNPRDWWNACVYTIRRVIEQSAIDRGDIAGIGISGQMHGLVMLDKKGEVLRDSILWCDTRTTEQCGQITRMVGSEKLIRITANPALEGFTAGKILWVKQNQPELYAKCRHILLPKDYLRYKLCGVFATEVSDASGTNLMDVPKRVWSEEILKTLDIEPDLLPVLYESYEVTGGITEQAAALTGLKVGTPVVGGAGDNAAAAVGTGVVEQGKAFTTIGTSGVIFAHTDTVRVDARARVHTFCGAVPGAWAVMSCTLSAGGSLQWFRNQFCDAEMKTAAAMGQDPYYLMDKEAERVPIGANRLLFLPYLMGERSPILHANARGVFFGLSRIHTRLDMLRAVMEGVIYSLRDCLDVLREMGIPFVEMLATGGGGGSPFWRQMAADIYGCPVAAVENEQGPALGAAILAGVGAGLYPDLRSACRSLVRTRAPHMPIIENSLAYEPYFQLYQRVYTSLCARFDELALL